MSGNVTGTTVRSNTQARLGSLSAPRPDTNHHDESPPSQLLPGCPADMIPRVAIETLLDILDGIYDHLFDTKIVIDCRFKYEYDGGHINGAVNFTDKDMLDDWLFENRPRVRTILVFHCEYSVYRAPLMAAHLRSRDRTRNAESYPQLVYPDIYVLDGRYNNFFYRCPGSCTPPEYIKMSDEAHRKICKLEMAQFRARESRKQYRCLPVKHPKIVTSRTAGVARILFTENPRMQTSDKKNPIDQTRHATSASN